MNWSVSFLEYTHTFQTLMEYSYGNSTFASLSPTSTDTLTSRCTYGAMLYS